MVHSLLTRGCLLNLLVNRVPGYERGLGEEGCPDNAGSVWAEQNKTRCCTLPLKYPDFLSFHNEVSLFLTMQRRLQSIQNQEEEKLGSVLSVLKFNFCNKTILNAPSMKGKIMINSDLFFLYQLTICFSVCLSVCVSVYLYVCIPASSHVCLSVWCPVQWFGCKPLQMTTSGWLLATTTHQY